jgi:hypothetical protein
LFTYFGLKLLYALRHGPLHFGRAGARTGVPPIPEIVYTGTYTVNRLNVDQFLS